MVVTSRSGILIWKIRADSAGIWAVMYDRLVRRLKNTMNLTIKYPRFNKKIRKSQVVTWPTSRPVIGSNNLVMRNMKSRDQTSVLLSVAFSLIVCQHYLFGGKFGYYCNLLDIIVVVFFISWRLILFGGLAPSFSGGFSCLLWGCRTYMVKLKEFQACQKKIF